MKNLLKFMMIMTLSFQAIAVIPVNRNTDDKMYWLRLSRIEIKQKLKRLYEEAYSLTNLSRSPIEIGEEIAETLDSFRGRTTTDGFEIKMSGMSSPFDGALEYIRNGVTIIFKKTENNVTIVGKEFKPHMEVLGQFKTGSMRNSVFLERIIEAKLKVAELKGTTKLFGIGYYLNVDTEYNTIENTQILHFSDVCIKQGIKFYGNIFITLLYQKNNMGLLKDKGHETCESINDFPPITRAGFEGLSTLYFEQRKENPSQPFYCKLKNGMSYMLSYSTLFEYGSPAQEYAKFRIYKKNRMQDGSWEVSRYRQNSKEKMIDVSLAEIKSKTVASLSEQCQGEIEKTLTLVQKERKYDFSSSASETANQ